MTSEAFSTAAPERACSYNLELRQLTQSNAIEARRLKNSSDEHKNATYDGQEVERKRIKQHCRNKLELCASKIKELKLAREALEELEGGISAEELEANVKALVTIEREAYILRMQLPRLAALTLRASHQVLSEAYAMALVALMKEIVPYGIDKELWPSGRENIDQEAFRQGLHQIYEPGCGDKDRRWCPISSPLYAGRTFKKADVKAAHLIPYSLGEVNCAYLFGLPIEEGYEALWNPGNGLILHKDLEKAFDRAVFQIVPAVGENQEVLFKVVVLDTTYPEYHLEPEYGIKEIEGQELKFRDGVTARPKIECLSVSAVLAALRRRRYACHGWANDYKKLFKDVAWPKIQLDLRKSTLRALAAAYGDSVRFEDLVQHENISLKESKIATASYGDETDETIALGLAVSTGAPAGSTAFPLYEDIDYDEDVYYDRDKMEELVEENTKLEEKNRWLEVDKDFITSKHQKKIAELQKQIEDCNEKHQDEIDKLQKKIKECNETIEKSNEELKIYGVMVEQLHQMVL
ncbi:hypothetical protein PV05_02455 [Exophiala xenobiotica]|uniref:HNH nuclease domain-containing protein n=1 Tax=Exophiala xenobiotica TaxID=348802 RepID=A0A0D2FCV4_9EURO|nr:uncharacterized protein PV05_02455 [Exophiala xenobiotica]KIW57899.1 hypothetical protein PV05_02455 [Exophiala xenobiotica]